MGVWEGQSPPGIWQISKPYSNQGADYAPHTTATPLDSKSYVHLCLAKRKPLGKTHLSLNHNHSF